MRIIFVAQGDRFAGIATRALVCHTHASRAELLDQLTDVTFIQSFQNLTGGGDSLVDSES